MFCVKMPQLEGYEFLNEGVYNSTTEPTKTYSVFNSIKKVVGQAMGTSQKLSGSESTQLR